MHEYYISFVFKKNPSNEIYRRIVSFTKSAFDDLIHKEPGISYDNSKSRSFWITSSSFHMGPLDFKIEFINSADKLKAYNLPATFENHYLITFNYEKSDGGFLEQYNFYAKIYEFVKAEFVADLLEIKHGYWLKGNHTFVSYYSRDYGTFLRSFLLLQLKVNVLHDIFAIKEIKEFLINKQYFKFDGSIQCEAHTGTGDSIQEICTYATRLFKSKIL